MGERAQPRSRRSPFSPGPASKAQACSPRNPSPIPISPFPSFPSAPPESTISRSLPDLLPPLARPRTQGPLRRPLSPTSARPCRSACLPDARPLPRPAGALPPLSPAPPQAAPVARHGREVISIAEPCCLPVFPASSTSPGCLSLHRPAAAQRLGAPAPQVRRHLAGAPSTAGRRLPFPSPESLLR